MTNFKEFSTYRSLPPPSIFVPIPSWKLKIAVVHRTTPLRQTSPLIPQVTASPLHNEIHKIERRRGVVKRQIDVAFTSKRRFLARWVPCFARCSRNRPGPSAVAPSFSSSPLLTTRKTSTHHVDNRWSLTLFTRRQLLPYSSRLIRTVLHCRCIFAVTVTGLNVRSTRILSTLVPERGSSRSS